MHHYDEIHRAAPSRWRDGLLCAGIRIGVALSQVRMSSSFIVAYYGSATPSHGRLSVPE
jgi:hypothetical protein